MRDKRHATMSYEGGMTFNKREHSSKAELHNAVAKQEQHSLDMMGERIREEWKRKKIEVLSREISRTNQGDLQIYIYIYIFKLVCLFVQRKRQQVNPNIVQNFKNIFVILKIWQDQQCQLFSSSFLPFQSLSHPKVLHHLIKGGFRFRP